MAEVRLCFGRGALGRIYNLHLRESSFKHRESLTQTSSLTSGSLSGCCTDGGLQGGENAEDRVPGGASRDSYTSVTAELGAVEDICVNVAEYHSCHGLNEDSLNNKTRGQLTGETLPRCWSRARLRRSFCSSGDLSQRGCWGQFVFIREFGDNGARSEPLFKTKTGYYEILEVLPSATQVQIKTAYYKQSFIFHPDRNAGSEVATVRFSDISEAYTVLGNKALRRKYDRGLLSQTDLIATTRSSSSSKDGTGGSATQQPDSRRSVAGADKRGGVYDFDKFFKSHYNEQLQRERDIRARREDILKGKHEAMTERTSKMTEMCVLLLMVMGVGLTLSLKRG
nr:PREDICTED: dnaJ homolog subfamily C member 30-like [Paralichthys olivaceus]